MRVNLIQLISALLIFYLIACNSTSRSIESAQNTPDMVADSIAIRTTLEGWYNAMYKVDSVGILSLLTPQFLLLEDTLPLNGNELFARLKKGGTDTKWLAAFSDFHTRFQGDVAWTTLKNHETALKKGGNRCQADFIETIVFVRKDKHWLIDRYHAAIVNQWNCDE